MNMSQWEIYPPPYWTTYTKDKTVKQWREEKGEPGPALVEVEVYNSGSYFNLGPIGELVEGTWQQDEVGFGEDAAGLASKPKEPGIYIQGIQVTRILRIENLNLYETYRKNQEKLIDKARKGSKFKNLSEIGDPITESYLDDDLNYEVNESFFFHGTKTENVVGIIEDGFVIDRANSNAAFGPGVYMTESSTKADQYADKKNERRRDDLRMFVVRCSLGDIYLTDEATNRAPCYDQNCEKDNCDHKRYDSIVAEEAFMFREFVVYDGGLTYPEYLIIYNRL